MTFTREQPVTFPAATGAIINMMPIVMGERVTLPEDLRRYIPMIDACEFTRGDVVYLTVHESTVRVGETQRRPGIHTDATNFFGWGGGWGGNGGIWMASSDGDCVAWQHSIPSCNVDKHGALLGEPFGPSERLEASTLYRMSDRTPHESLPATHEHGRQFFRLVGPDISGWFAQHNTPNPLGVLPRARVVHESKFA